MSKDENYFSQNQEINNPKDDLPKTEEISSQSRGTFTNPTSDLKENKIEPITKGGAELNNTQASIIKPKPKTINVVNTLIITAAASGSTILGSAILISNPSFTVSLFAKTSSSLIFEVNGLNINEDDRVVATLSYMDEVVEEQEFENQRYLPFYQLNESSEYRFEIYYYQGYFALDSEGNHAYDETQEPSLKYSSAFSTSNYSDEVGLEIDEGYTHENLNFTVYNETNLPFVTTRVSSEKNSEIFVNDSSENEISYEVHDIPYDEYIYISVNYGDRGLAFVSLNPIPSPESESESESTSSEESESERVPDAVLTPTSQNISFDSISLEFEIDDYTKIDQIHSILLNETLIEDYETSETDEGKGILFISVGDLTPDTVYELAIYRDNDILYQNSYQTDYLAIFNYDGEMLTVDLSDSFYNETQYSSYYRYEFELYDGEELVLSENDIQEQGLMYLDHVIYNNTNYTAKFYRSSLASATSVTKEMFYEMTVTFEEGRDRLTYFVTENEADNIITYNSLSLYFEISDVEFINDLLILFDDEEISVEADKDGFFSIEMTSLAPESSHTLVMINSNQQVLFEKEYSTSTLVSITNSDAGTLSLKFDEDFIADLSESLTNDEVMYYIYDKDEVLLTEGEINEEDNIYTLYDLYLFNETYTFDLFTYNYEQGERTSTIINKTFTLETALSSRPEFELTLDGTILAVTFSGGNLPYKEPNATGSVEYSFEAEIHSDEYSVEYIPVTISEDSVTYYIDLNTGSYPEDPYTSNYYDVTAGEYTLNLRYNTYLCYTGTFVIA